MQDPPEAVAGEAGLFVFFNRISGQQCSLKVLHILQLLLRLEVFFCCVAQAGQELLGLSNPASVSQAAEVTDLGHGVLEEETG